MTAGSPARSRELDKDADLDRVERERIDQERRDRRRLDRNRLLALQRLRELSGLSLRRAARSLGVTPALLRSWEDQRAIPTAGELDALIDLYACGLDDLLGPRRPLESPELPGVLVVSDHHIDTNRIREWAPDLSDCNRRILAEYLDAVRTSRRSDDERPALRSQDLMDLARVLDVSDHDLDQLLADALDVPSTAVERTSRALMIAGLMNTTIRDATDGGWVGGTNDHGDHTSSVDEANQPVFATMTGSSPTSALRKPVFSTSGTPVGHRDSDVEEPPEARPMFST